MNIEKLFEFRRLIGENLIKIIKNNGYTKSSFSRLIEISRPTLDSLIRGEIDNLSTFKKHIEKILASQSLTEDQLFNYTVSHEEKKEHTYAFSYNAPANYELKPQAKEMFAILEDITHLCNLYYK